MISQPGRTTTPPLAGAYGAACSMDSCVDNTYPQCVPALCAHVCAHEQREGLFLFCIGPLSTLSSMVRSSVPPAKQSKIRAQFCTCNNFSGRKRQRRFSLCVYFLLELCTFSRLFLIRPKSCAFSGHIQDTCFNVAVLKWDGLFGGGGETWGSGGGA